MRKSFVYAMGGFLAASLLTGTVPVSAAVQYGWEGPYWYENGVRQGYDADNPFYRGKEIYDPVSDAWYWLDNVQQGAKAVSKDVYQDSRADDAGNIGKWVRYDAVGHMVKGWDTNAAGTYFFDYVYGTMAKGRVTVGGRVFQFNEVTGILEYEVTGGTQQGGTSQGGIQQGGTSQGGTQQGSTSQGGVQQGGTQQNGVVTLETAKAAALADAGLTGAAVTYTKAKLDLDNGILVYEIEFYTAEAEYDYEISAATGAIIGRDMEKFQQGGISQGGTSQGGISQGGTQQGNTSQGGTLPGGTQNQPPQQNGAVTLETAKAAALADAGLAGTAVTYTKAKLDRDHGVLVYEIEFYTTEAEYDYEINAVTGAIICRDVEWFHHQGGHVYPPTGGATNNGSYIGEDRAKEIAAAHAGFNITDVVFTKAKLDWDDGRMEYEIEFYNGFREYEYSIDAYTGAVLEYEID